MAKIVRTRVAPAESYDVPDEVDETTEEETNTSTESPKNITTGWRTFAPRKQYRKTVTAPRFSLTTRDNGHVIKVLNNEPAATWEKHFVNSQGNKGFYCMQEVEWNKDEDGRSVKEITQHCPLCDRGHSSSIRYMMNVVDMSVDPDVVLTWEFGPEVGKQFGNFAEERDGKFTVFESADVYFRVVPEDVGRKAPKLNLTPLRAHYLDDWNCVALTEEALDELMDQRFGTEVVWIDNEKRLQDIADTLTERDLEKPDWGKTKK